MTATPDAASLGPAGEDLAAAYLEARGYRIVARNWRLASGEVRGELDLVARRDGTLVFVEVKTRRGEGFGGPLAAVTARKQLKLRALATAFLRHAPQHAARLRFDVIGVLAVPGSPPRITHVPDAF